MKEKKASNWNAEWRQQWAIKNEARLYFALQMVFAALQFLLYYVVIGMPNVQTSGLIVFILFGVALITVAGCGWQMRWLRTLGRAVAVVVVLGCTILFVGDVLTTGVYEPVGNALSNRPLGDYLGQLAAYACLYLQPIFLTLFPTFAIAARRQGKRADVNTLRIISVFLLLFSLLTWGLSFETTTRLDYSFSFGDFVSNNVLLIAHVICTVASIFSVYMLYPFGTKWIKARVEASRAKLQQKEK